MTSPRKVAIELSAEEWEGILEALDSHVYWELSDEQYRNNGYVYDKTDLESGRGSDDPVQQKRIEECRQLEEAIRAALPKEVR